MNVVVTIQHPAHAHFFKHVVPALEARGHDVHVFAREKDVALDLLDHYDVDYELLAGEPDSLGGLARTQATSEYRLWRAAKRIEPDVMTAVGGTAVAHVSQLVGARSVVWLDDEGVFGHRITTPFAHVVATPRQFRGRFGPKHVRYDGFQELAYLHPNRFDPDPDRLRRRGVDPEQRYSFVRFREWSALHDAGETGFSGADKRRLVESLGAHGSVYVVSESPLPPEFRERAPPVPPHLVHDLLYYADLYVGDSATTSAEAALLGTPAVRCRSSGDDDASKFVELADRGLLYSTADGRDAVREATMLAETDPTDAWRRRRKKLLREKIGVVGFAVDLLRREGRKAGGAVAREETDRESDATVTVD